MSVGLLVWRQERPLFRRSMWVLLPRQRMCIVTEVQFTVHFSKNLEDEQYILIEERVNCLTIKIVPSHGCHREE